MSATDTTDGRRTRRSTQLEPAPAPTEIAAQVAELAAAVGELTQRLDERSAAGEPPAQEAGKPPLYHNVEDWVREYLLVNFSRPFGEVGAQRWYWCQQWWRHNEAVTALTALWYAWEHARLQPTGILGWLRDLHYHLGVVCSADGPFRECAQADGDRQAKHTSDRFADVVPAPANWWNWWAEDEQR
jgi:hypothetical protein